MVEDQQYWEAHQPPRVFTPQTPAEQVIHSLDSEPEKWARDDCFMTHDNGLRLCTITLFIETKYPERKFNLFEKMRIRAAINRWNKTPIQKLLPVTVAPPDKSPHA